MGAITTVPVANTSAQAMSHWVTNGGGHHNHGQILLGHLQAPKELQN
jgi:hypothetical protein